MQRILVIGCGGAGKSTFAAHLAECTGLPLVHLDRLYWQAGWIEPSAPAWAATIERLVNEKRWIMDGNYGGSLEHRLAACDSVIFLDLPRWLCLWRVLRRRIRHRGRARPDMTPGCPERLSLDFVWWIWSYPWQRKPKILRLLAELPPERSVFVLRSTREIEAFLRSKAVAPTR